MTLGQGLNLGPLLALPVLLPLVLLQSALFNYLEFFSVSIQISIVFIVAFALWREAAEAVVWAFIGGLMLDLTSTGLLGVNILALILMVLLVSMFRSGLRYSRISGPLVLSALGLITFQLISLFLYAGAGYPISAEVWLRIPIITVVHVLLTVPVYWFMQTLSLTRRGQRPIDLG